MDAALIEKAISSTPGIGEATVRVLLSRPSTTFDRIEAVELRVSDVTLVNGMIALEAS